MEGLAMWDWDVAQESVHETGLRLDECRASRTQHHCFNHFPNRVAPLICFLGNYHNFRRQKILQQKECK